MSEFTGEIHPLADFFAMLPDDELQDLADDIATNGQTHPIVLDANGRLVDGRNRLAACERAGVEPTFTTRSDIKTDEQVAASIRSENNRRRNQSTGQQAATDALLLDAMGAIAGGRIVYGKADFADLQNPTQRSQLSRAVFILDNNRAALLKVAAGSLPIAKAYADAKKAHDAAIREAEDLQLLRDEAPDLYRYVTEDGMAVDEAIAAYERRNREQLAAEQAALNAWNRAIDGVTTALAYLKDGSRLPTNIPANRPGLDEFTERLEALNKEWGNRNG